MHELLFSGLGVALALNRDFIDLDLVRIAAVAPAEAEPYLLLQLLVDGHGLHDFPLLHHVLLSHLLLLCGSWTQFTLVFVLNEASDVIAEL